MVNHYAVAEYFERTGGATLRASQPPKQLNVVAFVADAPDRTVRATRRAFEDAVDAFGPDAFLVLSYALARNGAGSSIDEIVAALQLERLGPAPPRGQLRAVARAGRVGAGDSGWRCRTRWSACGGWTTRSKMR